MDRRLVAICLLGLVLRLVFVVVVAQPYFGRDDYRVDGDTSAWTRSFVNLVEHGSYTVDPGREYGYFGRLPAYAFFVGAFYLGARGDVDTTYALVSWVQVLLDVAVIVLIWLVGVRTLPSRADAAALATLYASYPFVIIWTPVVYSEWLGIALLVAGTATWARDGAGSAAAAGALTGLSALARPQMILVLPWMALGLLLRRGGRRRSQILAVIALMLGFAVAYGPWPMRNWINHRKLVLTQDLRAFPNWGPDTLAFLEYASSVQVGWEPQFSAIVGNKAVVFPAEAYRFPDDREKLGRAVSLAQTCGSGFSHWRGYWKERFEEPNCDAEIARLFGELRERQIRENPVNFWIRVPLANLKKAIFKTGFSRHGGVIRALASTLFPYRTLLLVVGVVGACLMISRGEDRRRMGFVALASFVSVYGTLCFGTLPQLRNIEMRYFLPADVLLLVPAAYAVNALVDLMRPRRA